LTEQEQGMSIDWFTYEHPVKCMSCSLHFTVWSWEEQWSKRKIYCPECGNNVVFRFTAAQHSDPIYKHVPGEQRLI
jgi:DNA-directed RNA polymerase subunit RPC12/RpoP